MRDLTGKPESWTPREQAAVVLNALYFAREALWNCKGSDAGDVLNDPLGGMCSPTIWFDDDGCPVATPINKAFCRPIQDRLEILRSPMFARWLESRGASNVRELLSRIQVELEKSDRLFDALRESGQVDEGYEDELLQRRAQRGKWPDWFLAQYREELAKSKPSTEALREDGWLGGPVPEQQLLDQIRELSSLSLQLETFVAGEDVSPPPTVPYLDLTVDVERQEVTGQVSVKGSHPRRCVVTKCQSKVVTVCGACFLACSRWF